MSDVTLSLAIGGVERVAQLGEYIAIKESNVPVDIHVQGVGTMKMQKGEVWRIKGGFDGFTIENYGAVPGTVLMAVGYGDYRAALAVGNLDSINTIVNPVNVQKIVDPVNVQKIVDPVNVQKIVDPVNVQKIIDPVNVQKIIDPVRLQHDAGSRDYFASRASSALVTIATPALNLNGIRIDAVSMRMATAGIFNLFFNPAAPGSYAGGKTIMTVSANRGFSAIALPLKIPPGNGLYCRANTAAYKYYISLLYEVL